MKYPILTIFILITSMSILRSQSAIEDSDGDTRVDTDLSAPAFDDEIHFTLDGDVQWKMKGERIQPGSSANLFMGFDAGELNTSFFNTYVGNFSASQNTSGTGNTAVGMGAMRYSQTSNYTTAIGNRTLENYNSTGSFGDFTTAVGNQSAISLVEGMGNTFFGSRSGYTLTNGSYNCIIGGNAALDKTSGNRNVIIGYLANRNGSDGDNNVFIGYGVAENETGSNKLYIENSGSTSPLIYGDFGDDELTINGFATVDRLDGAEEVARFISQSEPQITLYRGSTHAGDLQHYKNDLFLTNRANRGSVVIQTTDGGNTRVAASFYPDGDLDVSGDRIYFGNTEYLHDVGWRRIETNSSIQPSTCGYRDLGSSANRWDQLYIDNAVLVANCFSSGGGSGSSALANGQGDQYGLNEIMELKSIQGFKNRSNEITVTQLQEVMPALVEEYDEVIDEKTEEISLVPSENPSIRITDFIPVLVKSEQEQQFIIDKQEKRIIELEDKLNLLLESVELLERQIYVDKLEDDDLNISSPGFTLSQNQPNPAGDRTTLTYTIEQEYTDAELRIVDAKGRLINAIDINDKKGVLPIALSNWVPGIYYYSLIINGKKWATKQMVVVK